MKNSHHIFYGSGFPVDDASLWESSKIAKEYFSDLTWSLSAKKPTKNDFSQLSIETKTFSLRVVYEANVRYFE